MYELEGLLMSQGAVYNPEELVKHASGCNTVLMMQVCTKPKCKYLRYNTVLMMQVGAKLKFKYLSI